MKLLKKSSNWPDRAIKHLHKYRRIYLLTALIVSLGVILWNSYQLYRYVKQEERAKMEIWATAMQKVIEAPLGADVDLPSQIIIKNRSIPVIKTDSLDRILQVYNLDLPAQDSVALQKMLQSFKAQNPPFKVYLGDQGYQKLYYGNSAVLNKIKWYPIALAVIFLMFLVIVFLYYYTAKVSEENLLWAGMAKETAHQIGTPLSSLIGWVELLKSDPHAVQPEEMQRDIHRLEIISRRFGKVGSKPRLEKRNLVKETEQIVRYFKGRVPQNIRLECRYDRQEIMAPIDAELFSWVLENLIKNAMDAMPGGGEIRISLLEDDAFAYVDVEDQGKGIPKNLRRKIFETGFSTKQRGWGLGLSLAKRIIKDYHKGNIFVRKSVPGKGSIFRIKIPKNTIQ